MYQSLYAMNKSDIIQSKYIGVIDKDGWNCTKYKVKLSNNGHKFTIDYYMGLAHTSEPKLSDVLYSLIMDSDALNMDFNEWCDNYGYDSNSIKDLKVYKACISNGQKLYTLFNNEEIDKFKQLLENY